MKKRNIKHILYSSLLISCAVLGLSNIKGNNDEKVEETSYNTDKEKDDTSSNKTVYDRLLKDLCSSVGVTMELLKDLFVENSSDNQIVENTYKPYYNTDPICNERKTSPDNTKKTTSQIYDEYLTTYSKYFNFDSEKIISFARELTKDYIIPFSQINNSMAYNLDDMEANCMVFCHQISRDDLYTSLNDLGYSKEYFLNNNKIKTINDDLVLEDSNLTFNQFLSKICDMIDLDRNYTLAICYHESGHIKSRFAREQNNFAGLRGKDGIPFTFASPEAGIIALCRNLKRYEYMDINNMVDLSGMYVHGNIEEPDMNWAKDVSLLHDDIANNQDIYFGIENKNEKVYQKN